jgi:hypothetical protein
MAEAKTKASKQSVEKFISSQKDPQTRTDCLAIAKLMEAATGSAPVMWGTSIIGFGTTTIKYAGGREADWPALGFSPRKQNFALYGLGISENPESLEKLGKYTMGKGCLYIKRLSDVDLPTLKKLINAAGKRKKGK